MANWWEQDAVAGGGTALASAPSGGDWWKSDPVAPPTPAIPSPPQGPTDFDQHAGYDSGYDVSGQPKPQAGESLGAALESVPQALMQGVGSFLPKPRVAGVAGTPFLPVEGIDTDSVPKQRDILMRAPGDTAINPQADAKPFFGAGGQVDQLNARNAARDKFLGKKFQEIVAKPLDKLTKQDLSTYYSALPVPIPKEALTDPKLQEIYLHINDLYTGQPTIGVLEDGTPTYGMSQNKEQIAAEQQRMQAAGVDPTTWVQNVRASMADRQTDRDLASPDLKDHGDFVQGVRDSVMRGYYAIKGEVTGDMTDTKREMLRAQWREGIDAIRDTRAFWPKGREYARAIFQTTGQMAPSLLASYMTGNPEVGIYMMGGQAGLDDYGQKRAQGWSVGGAALHGTVTGAIEAGSELAGVKVGGALGLETVEAAAGHGFAQATEEAAAKSIFKGVKNATVRKTLETMGSMALEGGEETLADVMHSIQDYIANTPGDGVQLKSFIVGAIMGGAGQVPSWASFVANPTPKAAREAGIPQAAASRQVDLAGIADAAKEAVAERAAGEVANGVQDGRWQKVADSIDAAFDKYGGKIVRPIEKGYNAVANAVVESPPVKAIMDRILGDPEAKAAAQAKIAPQVAPLRSETPTTPQPTPTSPVDATVPPVTSEPPAAVGMPPGATGEAGGATGLSDIGGKAIVDNMYDAMLQRMKAGKSPEPNTDPSRPPMLEQLWNVVKKKGLATPEEFIDAFRKAQPQTPADYSRILDSFAARSTGQLGDALTKQLEGQADSARGIIPGNFTIAPGDDTSGLALGSPTPQSAAQPAPQQEAGSRFMRVPPKSEGPDIYPGRKPREGEYNVNHGLSFLEDVLNRSHGKTAADFAKVAQEGFGDRFYWQYLQHTGQTLTQAFQQIMDFREGLRSKPSTPPATEASPSPSVAPTVSPASEQSAPAGSGVEGVGQIRTNDAGQTSILSGQIPKAADALTDAQRGMLRDLGYSDPAIDAMPRREAIGNIRGKRKAPAAPLTAEQFRSQLHAAATSPEQADALYGLVEARAEATGQSVDEYVGKRIKAVERVGQERSEGLRQGISSNPRGEIEFVKDGRAIIRAFHESQDATTLAHELGHLFRRDLAGADLQAAANWAGAKNGKWTRAAEEKFTRGFERYLKDGRAPTPRMQKIFDHFKGWLSKIYAKVKAGPLGLGIPPEMRSVYDRLFTPPQAQESTNGAQGQTQTQTEAQGREGLLETPAAFPEAITSAEVAPSTPAAQAAPLASAEPTPTASGDTLFQNRGLSPTSTKNATVDAEREARGLPPLMAPLRLSNPQAWDAAMARIDREPNWQASLATELAESPRAIDPVERAGMLHMRVSLRNEFHDALEANSKAIDAGDEHAIADSDARLSMASAALDDFDDMRKAIGTESGRSLQAIKMMADEDYDLVTMERESRAAKGRPLTPEEHDRIAKLQKRITDLEAQLEAERSKGDAKGLESATDDAMRDLKRPEPRKPGKKTALDPQGEFEGAISAIQAKVEKDAAYEISPFVQKLARYFWGQGIREREPMIDALHGVLGPMIPDWTREQTQRAFSGYGDFTALSKDQVTAGLADLKTQTQQVLKIEALENAKPLEKTGIERRPMSDAARRLLKVVNELKRKFGVVTTDPATQLKSALEARKTYYEHRIADLKHEIETQQRTVKTKSPSPTDAALEALITEHDALKAQHEAIFGKNELTDEQRLKLAITAAERNEVYWNDRLANAKKGVFDPATRQRTKLSSPELDTIKTRTEAIKEQVKELHDLANPKKTPEQIALQSLKTRMRNEAVKLREKLANGDFAPKVRKEQVLDKEAAGLKADLDMARADYRKGLEADRRARMSIWKKTGGNLVNAYDVARTIMATGEFSFVLRQGKLLALAHPARTMRELGQAFRSFGSERMANAIAAQVKSHPWFEEATRVDKLPWTEEEGALSKQEEFAVGKWVGKIPLVSRFNRAGSMFLNLMRWDSYLAMRKGMSQFGEATPEERRMYARMAAEFTGRGGLGKAGEAGAVAAGRLLWSPRNMVSRFQVMLGHSLWGGSTRSRALIASEYARALGGLAMYYAILGYAFGDDKKDKPATEFDPRSSDFGKVVIGDTRLDVLGGFAQAATLIARVTSGQSITPAGDTVALRGDKQPSGGRGVWDVIGKFAGGKLHPSISTAINLLAQEDIVGNPVTPLGEGEKMSSPMTYWDIYHALRDHGYAEGTALGVLAFFGEGLQSYKRAEKDKALSDDPNTKQLIERVQLAVTAEGPSHSGKESLPEARADFKAQQAEAVQWVKDHKDDPGVRFAIDSVLASDSFKNALKIPATGVMKPEARARRRQAIEMRAALSAP